MSWTQKKLVERLDEKVNEYTRIRKLVKGLKMNVVYKITYQYYNETREFIGSVKNFNKQSIRFDVDAREKLAEFEVKQTVTVPFPQIVSYEKWDEQAPLLINWEYISPSLKEKFFM